MNKDYLLIFFVLISISGFAKDVDNKLFSLYPVPLNTNQLTVVVEPNSGISLFEIRSLIGRKLQEKPYLGTEKVFFNDMNQYPNGFYVVLAKDTRGKIIETIKFSIDR